MFKATAQSQQRREVNRIVNNSANTGGIDPDVFRPALAPEKTDRQELILRKVGLQEKTSKLSAQIALAKRRHFLKERGAVSYDVVLRWEEDRKRFAQEITNIDALLTNIRVDKHLQVQTERSRFVEEFALVAKEKLAGPIYKELHRMTMERLSEQGVARRPIVE